MKNSSFYIISLSILGFFGLLISKTFNVKKEKTKTNADEPIEPSGKVTTIEPKEKTKTNADEPIEPSGKVTTIEPIEILGTVQKAPRYKIEFDIEIGTFEKLLVSKSDIADNILKYTNQILGDTVGKPNIKISETNKGYHIFISIKTYEKMPTPKDLKTKIEKLDDRLEGRINNVKIEKE